MDFKNHINEDLRYILLNSDVDALIEFIDTIDDLNEIDEYIYATLPSIKNNGDSFDLSYEVLDILININLMNIDVLLVHALAKDDTTEKLIYVLDVTGITSRKIRTIIIEYAKIVPKTRFYHYNKKMLFTVIDYLNSKVNLDVLSKVLKSHYRSYKLADIVTYIVFRVINEELCISAQPKSLEKLIKIAIQCGHNDSDIVRFMLRYLADTSPYHSEYYRNNIEVLSITGMTYISLFNEDV